MRWNWIKCIRSRGSDTPHLNILAAVLGFAITPGGLLQANGDTLSLHSSAFANGESIPWTYTCQVEGISVPLSWDGVPATTRSLVLIVDDPDAPDPDAPRMTWVHWVLYNIPPQSTGLGEGAVGNELPAGTAEGLNDWKRTGYGGPCPPIGRHRYYFKLYAVNTVLHFPQPPSKQDLEDAMGGHVIEQTQLLGTNEK